MSAVAVVARASAGNNGTWDVINLTDHLIACDEMEWIIQEAHDINDDGWIAAWGINLDEQASPPRAVVLIPVPQDEGDADGDFDVDLDDLPAVLSHEIHLRERTR